MLNSLPPKQYASLIGGIKRTVQASQVYSGEFTNRKKDGTPFITEGRISGLKRPDQLCYVTVRHNVTDRKRGEELRQRLTAILEASPDFVGYADARDTHILYINSAGRKMVGLSEDEDVTRLKIADVHPEWTNRLMREEILPAAIQKQFWVGECAFLSRKGRETPVAMVLQAHRGPDGEVEVFSTVSHDITERKQLERQILEISDREQARIGQDIHDSLAQLLIGAAFDFQSLVRRLVRKSPREAASARRLAAVLDDAISEARHVSRGLFPVRLEADGLVSALQELSATVGKRSRIDCDFQALTPVAIEELSVATHLYRIAQEAVHNAVRHARARKILIRLRARAGQLELTVTDNGKGIPKGRRGKTGMGLNIMRYRAHVIGGALEIQTRRGGGTVISCCVPLERL